MAIYTRDDLVERVLVRLGEVGFGQSAEPESRARVTGPLDGILDELQADGVIDFATSSEIPGAAMDSLSAIVASKLADSFGVAQDETVLLASRAQAGQDKLRRLTWAPVSEWRGRRSSYF